MSSIRKIFAKLANPNPMSFYLLFLMWGILTLFYYFGELVDLAGWESLRWQFFYSVHDVHRLLFLIPIFYASYVFGIKASMIMTIISLMTFLPRALFISTYPNALARMLIFILVSSALSCLIVVLRREKKRTHR
jgi:hypothetical protein